MKKMLILIPIILFGCSSSVTSTYRFRGEEKLTSFEIKKEGTFAIDAILFINNVPVDTIKNLHGITKPSDSKVFSWNGKQVNYSASLNVLTGGLSYRVLVDNELVLDK